MHSRARPTVLWTARESARLTVDGPTTGDLVERLERVLNRLIRAHATRITVDLSRMSGTDNAVLELLAVVCHRLWQQRGCLHVLGLGRRSVSDPQVAALPEIVGDVNDVA